MKKTVSIILSIIFILSLFAGCNKTADEPESDIKDSETVNNGVKDDKSDYADSDKSENAETEEYFDTEYPIFNLVDEKDVFKDPISFDYNGKTITLKPLHTNITFTDIYPDKSFKFRDGAVRLDFRDDRKTKYLTKDGEIITPEEYENNYKTDNEFYPEYLFDSPIKLPNGNDGRIVGKDLAIGMTGEPGAYTQWLYNKNGELLNQTGFDSIGDFNEDGFALITVDHKVGVIDENGNILLEPTIAYDEIQYSLIIKTKESGFIYNIFDNAFILPIQNKVVIVTIE